MRLIGRDAELAALEQAVAAAADGPMAVSVLAGPGLGKSALLDAVVAMAQRRGWQVLRCRGVEAEAGLAYAAVTDLLLPARDALRGWLSEPLRRALDVVMLYADPGAEVVEPHAVARAVAAALRALSATAPLLLVVDDAHWLDAPSARTIAFAVRRLSDERMALVAAARDAGDDENEVLTVLRSLAERHATVRPGPLPAAAIEQLLHEHRLALPRASLRYVQDTAAGHPMYALELARHVAAGQDSMPRSLAGLLDERLRRLPAEALAVAAAAAEMAAPTRALIRSALPAQAHGVDPSVDCAVDAGILSEVGGALRFTHPLLARAASATTTAGWRREVHRRLAAVVTDDEQRALHLSLSHTEPDETIAAAVEAGAARARARAAPELAAELIAAALRLTPPEAAAARRRRRLEGAYHQAAAGRPTAAVELLYAALAEEPEGAGRVDLEWRAAMMHFLAGDLLSCVELLESAREHTDDPAVRNHLSTRLASMYCWSSDFPRAAEVAESIDLDQLTGVYRVNAMATLAVAKFGSGAAAGLDPEQVIAGFEQLRPPPPPHEHPIGRLVHVLTLTTDPARSAEVAAGALARAEDESDDLGAAWLAAALAHAELRAGRWDAAARAAEQSLRAGQRAGSAPARVMALGAAATVAAYRGDDPNAVPLAAELIGLGERQPWLCCVAQGHAVLGFLALGRADPELAREEYLSAYGWLDRQAPGQLGMPPLRWYVVDALLDAGDVGEAERRLDQIEAGVPDPLSDVMAAAGRARVAALRGDRATADAAFDRAFAAHERLGWPCERAVTLYYQGCALRDQRRRREARTALTEAMDTFTRLGATSWAARSAAALAAISGRAPSAPDALTRTEEEVAALAAAGLTNQQIADRLFISTKTVATHLSHTYAKLNVRSRTELAARMSRTG